MAKPNISHVPCFASNHMTMRQYGLYSKLRERSHKWGFIYFDGDDLAACFQKTSRDVIYDDCRILLKSGWFETVALSSRKKDGTYAARKMVALSHEEWMAKYPTKCKGTGLQPVVPQQLDKNPTSCPTATNQSLHGNQPVVPQQLTSGSPPTKTSVQPDSLKAASLKVGFDGSPKSFEDGDEFGNTSATDIALPRVAPSAPPVTVSGDVRNSSVRLFRISGIKELVEGTSYQDAERKVKAQREAYLERKGEL